jgi:hypothetical protein
MKLQRKTLIDCKEVNVVNEDYFSSIYKDDSNNYYVVAKDEVIAIFHNVENNNFELFKESDNA